MRVRLETHCVSERAAFEEVARLCGHNNINELPEEQKKKFYVAMWIRYHKGNYITPFLFKKNCMSRMHKLRGFQSRRAAAISQSAAAVTTVFLVSELFNGKTA